MAAARDARSPVTTIKVPQSLRRRIAREAATDGVTAAVFLAGLLDRYERDQRFARVRVAYSGRPDGAYVERTHDWDTAADEDLEAGAPEAEDLDDR